ncbi:peptidoglycan-binding protein [Lichenicola sp.]|uniref:peptidoglycan-binding protein n=1 Tax=Lichenicola sp. TaxID=2804529 RepID=UPI003B00E726
MTFIEKSRRGATIRPTAFAADTAGVLRRALLAATLLSPLIATATGAAQAADAPVVPSASAASTGSALLIGNGRSASLPALPDCEPALRDLGDRLRGQGDDVTEVMDAPGPALRAAIGHFAADLSLSGHVVVAYCGYAMADADKLFLLPADVADVQPADLPRRALIARTVSRILARHASLFVAELHVPPGPGNAAAVTSGIQSLREETAPDTHLAVALEPAAAGASLIGAFASAVSTSKDWHNFSEPVAGATPHPAATPPAPTASTATSPAPSAAGPSPSAPTVPGPAGQADAAASPGVASSGSASPGTAGPGEATAPATPGPDHSALPTKAGAAGSDAASAPTPGTSQGVPAATASAHAADSAPSPAIPGTPATGTPVASTGPHPAPGAGDSKPISLVPPRKPHVRPPPPPDDGGSPTIRRIQVALVARGLMKGDVTGHTDPATQGAVSAYQKSLGHPATGFLTYQEMSSLEPKK